MLELRSIQLLPAGRLSSAILRRVVRAAARLEVPFDAASDDERMPSFVRDAVMELDRRGIAVDEEMELATFGTPPRLVPGRGPCDRGGVLEHAADEPLGLF